METTEGSQRREEHLGGALLGTTVLLGARPQGRGFVAGRAGEQRPQAPTLSGGGVPLLPALGDLSVHPGWFLAGGEQLRAKLQPAEGNNLLPPTGSALVPALPRAWSGAVSWSRRARAANSPGTLAWCHSCPHSTCPSQGCSCWPPPALQPSRLMPEKGATSSPRVPATLPPRSCWPGASAWGRDAAAPLAAAGDCGAPRDWLTHPLLPFTGWPPDFSCLSTSGAGGTS